MKRPSPKGAHASSRTVAIGAAAQLVLVRMSWAWLSVSSRDVNASRASGRLCPPQGLIRDGDYH
jgi:hypothetical protein